jgi:hypothetical protein
MMKMMTIIFVLFVVMRRRWNETYREELKYSGKNQSQCNVVHHKSHID